MTTAAIVLWYFILFPSGFQSAVTLGPFPTRQACDAVRDIPLTFAPDQVPQTPPFGNAPSIAQRLSPCFSDAPEAPPVEGPIPWPPKK